MCSSDLGAAGICAAGTAPFCPKRKTAAPIATTAPMPRPTKSPILPAPGFGSVVDVDCRDAGPSAADATGGCGSVDTTVCAVPRPGARPDGRGDTETGFGFVSVIRIGSIFSAAPRALQN